ncbi:MAG TPA: hypothetical protein VKR78_01905, partial [Acidimicrobiales bacterium]|nr:hypothetical protein [Acidimicrobiales bacterium]
TPSEGQTIVNTVVAELDAGMADPSRGIVAVVVGDCTQQVAPGVEVTLSTADSQTIALNSDFGRSAPITDSTGLVVFVLVPAGPVTVTAIPKATGKPSGKVDALVRVGPDFPGAIVYVPVTPL